MTVVTLTVNPTVDVHCSVPQMIPDVKLRTSRPRLEPGGGGINVCRVVHRFGCEAGALWTRGGYTGQLLQELLDEVGIPHTPIPIEGNTRQSMNVSEESSDQQFRLIAPGPDLDETSAKRCLDAVETATKQSSYLVLSGSLPPGLPDDFYASVAQRAPADCRVIVDASGAALQSAMKCHPYLIKPNLRELAELCGRDLSDDDEIVAAAREVIDRRIADVVVVSLGAGGALLVTAEQQESVRSPTVPIRSRIGAGDSMLGGLVSRLVRGDAIIDAVRFGVAAGAAAVMTPGSSLCCPDETQRLFESSFG